MSDRHLTASRILRVVADQAGLSVEALIGRATNGKGPADVARQRAAFLVRRLRPLLSMAQIGRVLGGRRTASVRDASAAAEARYAESAEEREEVQAVLDALGVTLPDGTCTRGRRGALDRQINTLELRLARLRAERAALEA